MLDNKERQKKKYRDGEIRDTRSKYSDQIRCIKSKNNKILAAFEGIKK